VACANLRLEKENVTVGYQRLLEKHKALVERVERKKAELAEAHTTELAEVKVELDK
jgi:hypothetical protein